MQIYTVTGQPTFPCCWLFFFMIAHSVVHVVEQHCVSQGNILKLVSFFNLNFIIKINKIFKTYRKKNWIMNYYSTENRKNIIFTSVTQIEKHLRFVFFSALCSSCHNLLRYLNFFSPAWRSFCWSNLAAILPLCF